jgi:hypothetical protein
MSAHPPAVPPNADFDVSVDTAPKPGAQVVEGQAESEEEKRGLDAALASTFDPAHTHDGKSDEELIAERDHARELIIDVAIVTGVIVAHEAAEHTTTPDETAPPHHGGDSN